MMTVVTSLRMLLGNFFRDKVVPYVERGGEPSMENFCALQDDLVRFEVVQMY